MKNYGIPYQGSKSRIIKELSQCFPSAENFYDLFGGGFSVTHYLMQNNKQGYKNFYFNEIRSITTELIKDAISGKYNNYKPDWISRETFFKEKETNAYIKYVWSFGNNGMTYIFGKNIESYKKSMHMAVVFSEFDELSKNVLQIDSWPSELDTIKKRRLFLRRKIESYRKTHIPTVLHAYLSKQQLEQLERLQQLQQLEQLERLQQLQQLEQLERLQQLDKLIISSLDYRDVKIHENSIIYCDIPYKNTGGYGIEFNHEDFLNWASELQAPVYISEYEIQDSRFHLIKDIKTTSTMSFKSVKKTIEKLYCNEYAYRR